MFWLVSKARSGWVSSSVPPVKENEVRTGSIVTGRVAPARKLAGTVSAIWSLVQVVSIEARLPAASKTKAWLYWTRATSFSKTRPLPVMLAPSLVSTSSRTTRSPWPGSWSNRKVCSICSRP